MKLANKLAFITGGGRGIGRAIAFAFAREGASVALAARTRAQVDSVADEIASEFGVETLALECDVADAENVGRAFAQASEQFGGGPDILVNNAASQRLRLSQNRRSDVATSSRSESDGHVSLYERGAAGNARTRLGPHHQYCFNRGQNRRAVHLGICGVKARRARFDAIVGA